MATSTESTPSSGGNPPAKSPVAASGSSGPKEAKDAKGLSGLDEANLERTIIRRGLSTPQEVEICKAHRAKLVAKEGGPKSLLEVMVAAKALTQTQAQRLLKDMGESQKKFEIPGYQILNQLGKGSMGIVYKAKQASVNRIVAVKVLLDALALNKEFIKRFQREAEIAAKLSHNNIVGVIDAGEIGGHQYFVMEYVEGETIKDMVEKGRVFDEKTAVKIVLAVADALQHAHKKGLIHRDVKPENIILTKDGNVKLADLGLARPTADEKWAMAEAGMAIGTPYYISPEQVRGQVDVDIRADIYCLGGTLYHMVTGKVPYSGETPTEVMKKHVDKNTPLIPPDHINTKLSSGLGEVVEMMMAKNREERYRNPDDLILDLKCLLQGEAPMLAQQKSETLANLAEGEFDGEESVARGGGGASESEMIEMATIVNTRTNIIAALAILLGLSIVSNVIVLLAH
jgi:serine/threonine-protein kinase